MINIVVCIVLIDNNHVCILYFAFALNFRLFMLFYTHGGENGNEMKLVFTIVDLYSSFHFIVPSKRQKMNDLH